MGASIESSGRAHPVGRGYLQAPSEPSALRKRRSLQRERQNLATGKVRIFELAKEVGLSSKDLISLFNERLGGVFEAKNQLSVVPDHSADFVRSVRAAPRAKASAGSQTASKPAAASQNAAATKTAAPAAATATAAPPEKPELPPEPIPTLKPVTGSSTRRPAAPAKPAAKAPETPAAPAAAPNGAARTAAPPAQAAPTPVRRTPAPPADGQQRPAASAAPVQRLRPVPSGQSSVLPPRRQAPPPTTSASASPGPQT